MNKFNVSRAAVTLAVLGVLSIVLNVVGAFVLPDKLQTQISFGTAAVELMDKYMYLTFSGAIIAICSGVGLYLREKRMRYLVVDIILSAANVAVFVYNMMR